MLAVRKPILCYVTDRRAMGAASISPDSAAVDSSAPSADLLHNAIRRATTAGAEWIQIREKDLAARALLDLARFAVSATTATTARVLVNDRLDVALAAHAAGVHLGENSLPVQAVSGWRRSSGRSDFLIGVSCHSLESARAAERDGADYVFFGPVFATPSKAAFGGPQGIERLHEVCVRVKIPVLAIGGIDSENAGACIAVGAAGIAAIRFFQDAGEEAELAERLKAI